MPLLFGDSSRPKPEVPGIKDVIEKDLSLILATIGTSLLT